MKSSKIVCSAVMQSGSIFLGIAFNT